MRKEQWLSKARRLSLVVILTKTHKDLAIEVAVACLREDLFNRRDAFIIAVPTLKETPDDFPYLAGNF